MAIFKYLALVGIWAIVTVCGDEIVDKDFVEKDGIKDFVEKDGIKDDDVIVLTDANYKQVIESHPILLVEFYAPWCGHCKNLSPHYAEAATKLLEEDPPIHIAKVDATAETKVGVDYDITGFPTLKLFRGNLKPEKVKDYDGGRTADEIVKWMKKKAAPACQVIESLETFEKLTRENEVVILGILSAIDTPEKSILESIADSSDAVFAVTTSAEIIEKYKKTAPAIILFKSFDEGRVDYEGEFEQASVETFVKENSLPLVMAFSQEKAPKIFGGPVDVHLLLFTDESQDYHDKLVEAAKISAIENRGRILHITIPLSEDRIMDYFGFKESDLPRALLVNTAKGMKKFPFERSGADLIASHATFGSELIDFTKQYFAGGLKAKLKSAKEVDDTNEAVKVIVGTNFMSRVIDTDKDVLLEFYAPWCGHCKSLAEKYEELAEKFSGVESIVIAKIDATENEVEYPGVEVQGFPTILFFRSGKKDKPIDFDLDRDVAGFTTFLKKHARPFTLDGETHGREHDEL